MITKPSPPPEINPFFEYLVDNAWQPSVWAFIGFEIAFPYNKYWNF